MPSAMESRSAVFHHEPQTVEVYQAGTWWAGELLGWRHESDGTCRMWVRVVLDGKESTAWTDLAGLRLPERRSTVAPGPDRLDPAATHEVPGAAVPHRGRPAPRAVPETAALPVPRQLAAVPATASRPSGRRRAPETPEGSSCSEPSSAPEAASLRRGGRRRAPEILELPEIGVAATETRPAPERLAGAATSTVPAPRSGGRRRAPEGEVAALAEPVAVGQALPAPGRHRAAASIAEGRHRPADTGLLTAVRPAAVRPAVPSSATPARRLDAELRQRPPASVRVGSGPEPELLTRPMRLGEQVPHARRPRVDGTLTTA